MDFKDMALCLVLDAKVIKNLGKYFQTNFYYWREIIKGLLELEDSTNFAIELCKKTTEIIYDDKSMDYQKYTEIFYILLKKHPKTIWKCLCDDLLNKDKQKIWALEQILSGRWLFSNEDSSLLELVEGNDIIKWIDDNGVEAALIITRIIRGYYKDNDKYRFKPVTRYIINNYGYEEKVLNSIVFYMGPFSWVGSLIPFYEEKMEVLNEYIDHDNLKVKNWSRDTIDRIQQQIGREKIKEKEEEYGIYK